VWQDEATRAESVSGLPRFGDEFPVEPHSWEVCLNQNIPPG
jgi:hypothetical protein